MVPLSAGHQRERHTEPNRRAHGGDESIWLHRRFRAPDHVRPEMLSHRLDVIDDDYKAPIGGVARPCARVDESTFDNLENHASQTMETLHSPLAFLHTLEGRTGDSLDLGACRSHVIGEHHDMIDANDIHRRCGCFGWLRGRQRHAELLEMLDRQPCNSRHRARTSGEYQMMESGRQRFVDNEIDITQSRAVALVRDVRRGKPEGVPRCHETAYGDRCDASQNG